MYTETVVFTGHKVINGNGARGPWSKSIFTDQQGREFGIWTNNAEGAALASQLLPLLNQSVTVEFEANVRTGSGGKTFTNYDIKSAGPANGAAPAPVTVPVVTQPVTLAAPPQQTYENDGDRQLRIMRQSALERALMAFGIADEDPLLNHDSLLELSDAYVSYFTEGRQSVEADKTTTVVAGPVD